MATINGRSLEDFFVELGKPVDVKKIEKTEITYISVDEVKKRVRELLLPSNYDFVCSPVQFFNVKNDYSFSLNGRLTIKDDDGQVVLVREIPGGCDVSFMSANPDSLTSDIKTTISSAESYAFVNCWLAAGLASCVELSYKKKKNNSASTTATTTTPIKRADEVFDLEFLSDLSVSKETVKGVVKVKGETREFRIFKEGLSYFENNNKAGKVLTRQEVLKCLVDNFGVSKARKSLKCFGYFNDWNGQKQFILTKGA